jgi:hypothetical protein
MDREDGSHPIGLESMASMVLETSSMASFQRQRKRRRSPSISDLKRKPLCRISEDLEPIAMRMSHQGHRIIKPETLDGHRMDQS